jgi:hypothetical protein
MRQRHISRQDVEFVLSNYDSRRQAQLIRGKPASEIFIATVRGRRLRVYAEEESDPVYITTVAWEDGN